jgi:hypothetical protein
MRGFHQRLERGISGGILRRMAHTVKANHRDKAGTGPPGTSALG